MPEVKPAKMLVRGIVADPLYMTSEDDCDGDGDYCDDDDDDCDDDGDDDDDDDDNFFSHMTAFHHHVLCQSERGEDDDEITMNAFIIMRGNTR